ncbi:MAG TPA: hypothetical protein PLR25_14035 [Planctomycetaceae bacterium]|nr:hypothetical protein [Planctomycetaceae bacterium]
MFVLKETTVNSAELLSTELFSAEPDECIGYGKTDAAPPWIMIGLAAVFMLFGVGLAAGCSPMLFSQLPAEAQGGAVGVGVGVIMALFAALLVHSAKSKAIVHGVRFYRNGIRLHGSRNETLQPYGDLKQFHVVAIRPGRRLSVRGVFYFLIHLVGGHFVWTDQGVQVTSFNYLSGGGGVTLATSAAKPLHLGGLNVAQLEAIALAAEKALGRNVSLTLQA